MWGIKEVIAVPKVVGALGAISTDIEQYIAAMGIEMRVEHAQKAVLLGQNNNNNNKKDDDKNYGNSINDDNRSK